MCGPVETFQTEETVLTGIKTAVLYWIAGASLVGAWCVPQLLGPRSPLPVLRNVGWGVWALAAALIWASLLSSLSKREAQHKEDGPCASLTIGGGFYAVIRHPRYLGWLLMYVAVMTLTQHWSALACAVPGMASVYLISRQEDVRLAKALGSEYDRYKRCVPALNLVAGLVRLLRRRRGGPPAGGVHPARHFGEEDATPSTDVCQAESHRATYLRGPIAGEQGEKELPGCSGKGCEIRANSPGAGHPNGIVAEGCCFCLICGHRQSPTEARLCSQSWCPKCGARMMHG
jgi:protein-S-isoprenylcysteine O-methyltransferase Ste14